MRSFDVKTLTQDDLHLAMLSTLSFTVFHLHQTLSFTPDLF